MKNKESPIKAELQNETQGIVLKSLANMNSELTDGVSGHLKRMRDYN